MGIIDIVIIAIVAICGVFGFFKGFFKSLVSFFGFAISVILAVFLAKYAAKALLSIDAVGKIVAGESGSLFSFIRSLMWEEYQIEGSYNAVRHIHATGGDAAVRAMFEEGNWIAKNLIYPIVKSGITNPVYFYSDISTIGEVVALEVSFGIYCFVVGVLLFFVLRITAAVISLLFTRNCGDKKNFFGRFLGLGIGAAKGVVNAFVILCILSLLANFNFMKDVNQSIDESKLAKEVMGISVKATSMVLDTKPDDSRFEALLTHAGFTYVANPIAE